MESAALKKKDAYYGGESIKTYQINIHCSCVLLGS